MNTTATSRKTKKTATPTLDRRTLLQQLDALMTHPPVIRGMTATTVPSLDPFAGRWCVAVYNVRLGTYRERPLWLTLANALCALRVALNQHIIALHDLCTQLDLLGDDAS